MQKTTSRTHPAYTAAHSVAENNPSDAVRVAEFFPMGTWAEKVHAGAMGLGGVLTDHAVFDVTEEGLLLREIISHATLDDVRAMTAAPFALSPTWCARSFDAL